MDLATHGLTTARRAYPLAKSTCVPNKGMSSWFAEYSTMTTKLPRAIRLLSQHGDAALRASLEKGKYIKPMIPKRIAANARKRAIRDGTYGTFEPGVGGWDPAWDTTRKMFLLKPYKGHVRERNRPDRAKKVTTAMEGMPARFEQLAKDVESRKPKKDIAYMFRRVAELKHTGSG